MTGRSTAARFINLDSLRKRAVQFALRHRVVHFKNDRSFDALIHDKWHCKTSRLGKITIQLIKNPIKVLIDTNHKAKP